MERTSAWRATAPLISSETRAQPFRAPAIPNIVSLEGVLAMQRAAGNAAVRQVVGYPHSTTVQRQRVKPPQSPLGGNAPYVAAPAVLSDCVSLLQRAYATQSSATLAVLRSWKTVAVGAVVDPDEPNVTKYHWTANGNWNDPRLAAAMDALGVRRWDADPARQPRGAQGAPGDAEQRMMSGNDVLKAIAVSRPPCGDCAAALADYGTEHGRVLIATVPPPSQREQRERENAFNAIRAAAQRLRGQLQLYEGEHKAEAALINTPSFTGFAGYWTNRLFNREVPPPTIWTNAYGSLLAVDSALARGDVRGATANLMRARRYLLVALRNYVSWKDGIDAAGTKAQLAIGALALATIAVFVAGPAIVEAVVEALTGGAAEVGAGVAEEQTAVRIGELIARGDQAVLALEEAATEAEIEAQALEEVNAFYQSLSR